MTYSKRAVSSLSLWRLSLHEDGSEFSNDRTIALTLNRERLAWLRQHIGNKPSVNILWAAVNKKHFHDKKHALHLIALEYAMVSFNINTMGTITPTSS